MGTPPPHPTQTRSHLSGGSSRSRAMVQCGLPPLILPLILIIAPSNTQGIPGCNSLLCQLLAEQLAEQGQLPELYTFSDPPVPHKRVPGMEFVGKRAPGMEFLGKRAPGMEFVGKGRREWSSWVKDQAILSSCIGTTFLCQRCLDWSWIRELEMENEADEGHRKSVSQFYQGIAGDHIHIYTLYDV